MYYSLILGIVLYFVRSIENIIDLPGETSHECNHKCGVCVSFANNNRDEPAKTAQFDSRAYLFWLWLLIRVCQIFAKHSKFGAQYATMCNRMMIMRNFKGCQHRRDVWAKNRNLTAASGCWFVFVSIQNTKPKKQFCIYFQGFSREIVQTCD